MTETLRTIRLYGTLGTKFGRVHRLAVASTAEAIRALSVLLPGFERELINSKDRGVGYACFLGKRNLQEDRLHDPAGQDDIRIAPMLMGAKSGGLFAIILGAVLVYFTGGIAAGMMGALGEGGAMAFAAGAASVGKMLILSGVAQMLAPQQQKLSTRDGPDNGASYNFNGPVNTTAQGNAVPLLYGEMFIGSATISAGIFAEDQQ